MLRSLVCLIAAISTLGLPLSAANAPVPQEAEGRNWVLKLDDGADPEAFAAAHGLRYMGVVGALPDMHRFMAPEQPFLARAGETPATFDQDPLVRLSLPQVARWRTIRADPSFNDPLYPQQWHWRSTGQEGATLFEDANLPDAWAQNVTGKGILIGIVDSGIYYRHPDLADRYSSQHSYDFRNDDADPIPDLGADSEEHHGTAVAGIAVASANNGSGGIGAAPAAQFGSIRLIPGLIEDWQEAGALNHGLEAVDIYNNSWGPSNEEGVSLDGPSFLGESALQKGATDGRDGLGSIYVFAAGNDRELGDRADYDGYVSSIYTIGVGAVGADGRVASYSEPGSSLLVCAPSGGKGPGIVTTSSSSETRYRADYTHAFNGTSAAAPIVSGVVALMLEANPGLSWRDVQHILVRTAAQNDPGDPGWAVNGAGHTVHHDYGHGRVDAGAAVSMARLWRNVGDQEQISSGWKRATFSGSRMQLDYTFTQSLRLEHVELQVDRPADAAWADLRISLRSPSGTVSIFCEPHVSEADGPVSWTFMSTRHWDESLQGTWRVIIDFEGSGSISGDSTSVAIKAYGTDGPGGGMVVAAQDYFVRSTDIPLAVDAFAGQGGGYSLLSLDRPQFGQLNPGDDSYLYAMDPQHRGEDQFAFLLVDENNNLLLNRYRVLNPLPAAVIDQAVTLPGEAVTLNLIANDWDPEDQPLSLVSVGDPRAEILGSGMIRFSGNDQRGWARFPYIVSDGQDGQTSGYVKVIYAKYGNRALEFDGIDDVVTVPGNPALGEDFSIDAWIYLDGWGEHATGFGRIADWGNISLFTNGEDHAFYNDHSLVCHMILGDGTEAAINSHADSIQLRKWTHVAVSYDADGFPKIFIDGVEAVLDFPVGDKTSAFGRVLQSGSARLLIGEAPSGERAFNGRIASWRLWGEALSGEALLDRGETANELLVALNFGEGAGQTTQTYGAHAVSATIEGASWTVRNYPWQPILDAFPGIRESPNGWWEDAVWGWLYADDFPWVLHLETGWIYLSSADSGQYIGYLEGSPIGWFFNNRAQHPWAYSWSRNEWVWLYGGWYYSTTENTWLLIHPGS